VNIIYEFNNIHTHIQIERKIGSRAVSSDSAPRGNSRPFPTIWATGSILSANKGAPYFYETMAPGEISPFAPPP